MKLMNYNQSSIVPSISHALDDLRYQDIYALVATFIQSNLVQPLVWAVVSLLAAKEDLQLLISQLLSTLTDPQLYIGLFNAPKAYIEAHPWQTTFFVIIIIGIILLCNPLVMMGFGSLGPMAGTLAAAWQSTVWGGAVAAGSVFAMLQSCGMLYPIWIPVIGAIIIGASIIAVIAALVWGGAD